MIFPAHNQDVEKFAEKFSENEWKKIAEIQIETKFFLLEHVISSLSIEYPQKIKIVTEENCLNLSWFRLSSTLNFSTSLL